MTWHVVTSYRTSIIGPQIGQEEDRTRSGWWLQVWFGDDQHENIVETSDPRHREMCRIVESGKAEYNPDTRELRIRPE
jgi:hypothetical protein